MHGERNSRRVKTPFIGVLGISNLQSPLLQRVLWLGQWPESVFQKFQFAYSFYGYGHFVCMCVYASHASLVPCRGQKSVLDPLRLKLQISRYVNAENWTQSSWRATCALHRSAIAPAPCFKLYSDSWVLWVSMASLKYWLLESTFIRNVFLHCLLEFSVSSLYSEAQKRVKKIPHLCKGSSKC